MDTKIVGVVGIIFLLGMATVFTFSNTSDEDSIEYTEWKDVIEDSKESQELNIFIDSETDIDNFIVEQVIPVYEQEYGIKINIETGHWSGVQQNLINEKLGGSKQGKYDVVIMSDEPMGRSIESNLIWGPIDVVENYSDIEEVFLEGIQGIENDQKALTFAMDQYILVGNTKFLDRAYEEYPNNVTNLVQWLVEQKSARQGIDPGRLAIPAPSRSNTGAAFLMLALLTAEDYQEYRMKPYDNTKSENWLHSLNFIISDAPEAELEIEYMPDRLLDIEVFDKIQSGQFWIGYVRQDYAIEYLASDENNHIAAYMPESGTIISGIHAGITFNSQNKAAGLLFLELLLSEQTQTEIVNKEFRLPANKKINNEQLSSDVIMSRAWIDRDEIRNDWLMWPHYQYKIELQALWRVMTAG
ncbi:MAG: extracellular solute-binding protein [Thermoproteota archaeon]